MSLALVSVMERTIEDTRSLLEVIIQTITAAVTTVVSLMGNSLVCVAFYRNRRLRTVTNFCVLSLAIADLTVASLVYPFSTIASGFRRWPFSHNFCQFSGFLVYYWAQVSLCILALTAINRYFCVVKPHRYATFFTRKKTALSIFSVWIFLSVFYLTFTFTFPVVSRWEPYGFHYRGCLSISTKAEFCTSFMQVSSLSLCLWCCSDMAAYIVWSDIITPSLPLPCKHQAAMRQYEHKTLKRQDYFLLLFLSVLSVGLTKCIISFTIWL